VCECACRVRRRRAGDRRFRFEIWPAGGRAGKSESPDGGLTWGRPTTDDDDDDDDRGSLTITYYPTLPFPPSCSNTVHGTREMVEAPPLLRLIPKLFSARTFVPCVPARPARVTLLAP
jgi:hypothetical protein